MRYLRDYYEFASEMNKRKEWHGTANGMYGVWVQRI